jgi:cytidylate kinase
MSDAQINGALGLDGHDGAGKTTLALALARAAGASYARPFSGAVGRELMAAAEKADTMAVCEIGHRALTSALEDHGRPLVLDRSWMTVASLVPTVEFNAAWSVWIPTVLCWTDLPTTLSRLASRREEPQSPAWHQQYLERYLAISQYYSVPVLHTTDHSVTECIVILNDICDALHTAPGGE